MGGVTVAWEDVISVINLVKPQLIGIGVLLAVALIAVIAFGKVKKPLRGFLRASSMLAWVLVTVLMVNMMLTGPLYNTLNVVLTEAGSLSEENKAYSLQTVEEITEEGIILAKNDGSLPLAPGNVNVFGWASTNPIYGGTGSGAVDVATAVDILGGLRNAGFTVNQELADKYVAYRSDRPSIEINSGQEWSLPEPPAATYDQALIDSAKEFSDTAIIVIARSGGEGADLPHDMGKVLDGTPNTELRQGRTVLQGGSYWEGTKYTNALYTPNSDEYADFEYGEHYLELSRTEKDLVDLVTSNFDKVVIVYNGANPLEMGWTEDYEQIRGVLLVAGPGATGFNALGRILSGDVNPSGRTVDTWVKDLTRAPWYNNIGHFNYTDDTSLAVAAAAKAHWERADGYVTFVNYVENIYVGYKFYETAFDAKMADFDYDAEVMYPFGYGLSYTEFAKTLDSVELDGTTVTAKVTVTNNGTAAGKDVAELYFTPPYTEGGIEKASVNLVGFEKTAILDPGASEELTITFDIEDMASFDAHGAGTYVLEAGDYVISLRENSHEVIDSQTLALEEVIYGEDNLHNEDQTAASALFAFAEGDVNYLSRAGAFANYAEATAAPSDFTLKTPVFANGSYSPEDYNDPADVAPATGAKGSLEAFDLRGASFEDPRWEELLDMATVEDMVNMIAYGGHQTAAMDSIGKLRTLDTDGPAGMCSPTLGMFGTGYCCNMIIAQTWNRELAYRACEGICREFHDFGVSGWYAPSMNTHRFAFSGRNFEYYSEDGFLSGEFAREQVKAYGETGVYPYIKHFALNDQETNRNGILCTWTTEQAMREIYLKPFEEAVKENVRMGGAEAGYPLVVMSSYNYVGSMWAAECPQLQKTVLRDEWGFRGMVLSDYFGNYGYMDADRAIRGGTDIMLGTSGNDAILTDTSSATSLLAMRQSTKDVLYTTINSAAYENFEKGAIPAWLRTAYTAEGIVGGLAILLELLALRGYPKKKKQAAQ